MAVDVLELLERLRATGRYDHREGLWKFKENDPSTREALLAVRRHGPARLRAVALEALAYVAGESGLDPADVALVERLVRTRLRVDRPDIIRPCWMRWWCVSSDDQAAVMASIGLHHPRPVTCDLACAVIDCLEHCREGRPLVYVSPAHDGWTMVVGPWCDAFTELPDHPGGPVAARATVERLSAEFGTAHAFYECLREGESAWLVAEDGATLRFFDGSNRRGFGEPLPVEWDWMRANGLPGQVEDHFDTEDDELFDLIQEYPTVREIAAEISDRPRWFCPTEDRHGLPVIATLPGFSGAAPFPPTGYTI